MYNFDQAVSRRNTSCVKWDAQARQFGSNENIPFWIADMDFEVAPCITEALKKRVSHPVYGYALPPKNYRKAICDWFMKWHSYPVQPEWIVPAQHTVTTLTIVLAALTEAGDSCLVLTPAYDPFFQAVTGTKRRLVCLPMEERDGHYAVDFGEMEKQFAKGIRCLIFCNPHNPGGKCWTREELSQIAALCRKYDVLILSDDVHCDWAFAPYAYTPIASFEEARDRTVMFTAPSKSFNLPAVCTSNMLIPNEELRGRVQGALNVLFIKGPNQFGYIATEAAYAGAGDWLQEAKEYVAENDRYAREYWSQNAPELKPFALESTFLLWIDCRALSCNSQEICKTLAKNYGISVNSGSPYGTGGEGFIRMNLACPRSILEVGVKAMARWCREERKKGEGI